MDNNVAAFGQDELASAEALPPLVHVVEDDLAIRWMMVKLLKGQGLRVIEHGDAYAALAQAPLLEPDLALIDVNLPVMNGIALCDRLRQLERYQRPPIAMLTALADDNVVTAAFAAGATDYILKPIHPEALKRKASHLIRAYRAERELRAVEKRMRSIVQRANAAMLTLDAALRVIELNPKAESLLGAAVGQSAADLIDAGRPLSAVLPSLAQTGRAMEAVIRNAQGSSGTVELACCSFPSLGRQRYMLFLQDITERRRAEQALQASHHLLALALDALSDAVALSDADGSIQMVNKRWREFAEASGLPASERPGVRLNRLRLCEEADLGPYPEARALGAAIRLVTKEQARRFDLECPRDDPDKGRRFLTQAAAVDGLSPARRLASRKSATGQPQREDLWTETLLDAGPLLDAFPHGLALISRRRRILFVNEYLAGLLGESPAQCRGRRAKRYLSFTGWQQFKQFLRPFLADQRAWSGGAQGPALQRNVTLRTDDGCLIPVSLFLRAIEGGRVWLALVESLAQQLKASEALRRRSEEWEMVADSLPNMILLEDPEGRVWRCNRAVAKFLNLPYSAIIGQMSGKLFFGRTGGSLLEAIDNPAEAQIGNDDQWFRIESHWIEQERGIGVGWVHVISDITAARLAEQDMRRLATAIEEFGEGVAMFDRRGRILSCTSAFEKISGLQRWEAIGQRFTRLGLGPVDSAIRRKILGCLARGQSWQGRYKARRQDGTIYWEQATVSPVHNARGELRNVVVVCRDVTEALRYESIAEALNVTENASYIFSAIRHEIGNPINSIKTALSVLRGTEQLSPDAVKTWLDRCLAEIGRVEYLLRTLRSFSLHESLELNANPLAPFLERFCALIKDGLTTRRIELETRFSAALGLAQFDERALHQALMNLISNAVDAMTDTPEPRLTLLAERCGRLAVITVRDNGRGIDAEQMRHTFKPFYTSKPHGTGLGLVITRKLLSKMNGTVELRSLAKGGCEAVITLEAVDDGREP
ncbi:MAG: hypothetical protein CFK52_00280 [Chloracidobacterium sp. CP2_5A]|nr:MAG: hypothetical protein CFK52_00280 [Chloracidobacterium sp. CP2_5A]